MTAIQLYYTHCTKQEILKNQLRIERTKAMMVWKVEEITLAWSVDSLDVEMCTCLVGRCTWKRLSSLAYSFLHLHSNCSSVPLTPRALLPLYSLASSQNRRTHDVTKTSAGLPLTRTIHREQLCRNAVAQFTMPKKCIDTDSILFIFVSPYRSFKRGTSSTK